MLPCVCSVIEHRRRQNVVRASVTHSATPRVPLFCSYHILTSSVIYYWTDARSNLFVTLMTAFLMIFRFPTTFWGFLKISQNCSEGQTNVPEHFPKMSEYYRRLSRKTRWCFDDTPTNSSTSSPPWTHPKLCISSLSVTFNGLKN